MTPAVRRIYLAIVAVAILTGIGTLGYVEIEGMRPFDALYMTVITITTVGYEEVQPLDTGGRIFTMILIFVGVGTAYYLFAAVTETVVGGQMRELFGRSAMNRKINQMEKHVILCGYGRFGRIVAEELKRNQLIPVIIEVDPAKEAELTRAQTLYVIGSALDENVLDQAGITRARDIVVATASDPDNVYISLSARSRNPNIRIHARAESEIGLKHLHLAGVERAISSYQYSAMRIASAIARPSVVDFLSLILPGSGDDEISIEEITLGERSALAGKTIGDVEQSYDRLRVVALKRAADPISLIPASTTELHSGDLIIVIGSRASLAAVGSSAGA